MHLFLLGVSHRTAPVSLRERLDFSSRGLEEALARLAGRPAGSEAVVLSTCNRAELYVATEDIERARQELAGFFVDFHQIDAAEVTPHFFEATDGEAARHLFRVASGLDSLVVGEPQILGQVKDAYSAAATQHCAGTLLNKLFHWSFGVGKRVRSETSLAEGAVSVSYAAASLARKIFGDLSERSVLVVGAGEMGKLTALHLQSQGIQRISITSRTAAHATTIAEQLSAAPIPWEGLLPALTAADIVVTATGASHPILTRRDIDGVMRIRRQRPLFVIDIAVPRDVEADAGDIEQVFLYNIDDLQGIVQENLSRRAAEVTKAEAIVNEEVDKFGGWLRARAAIPTVVALRQRFENIRRAELQRLEPKLAPLPPEVRARVDEITRLIVEKLLLSPTEQLKAIGDPETMMTYTDALSRLFRLSAEDTAGAGDELASAIVGDGPRAAGEIGARPPRDDKTRNPS